MAKVFARLNLTTQAAVKKFYNISPEVETFISKLNDVVIKSLPTSYYDDKEKAKAFDKAKKNMELLRKQAKEEGIL